MDPFNDAVRTIVSHRQANGLARATLSEAAEDLDAFTCQRLGQDPLWCAQKKTQAPTQTIREWLGHAAPVAARSLANARTGAEILVDWVGVGAQPVELPVAQQRADVCIECEHNKPGHFFHNLTALVAKAIHEQRRLKLDRNLKVKAEEKLHTCAVCECHLPLLVWVPASVLAEREPAERLTQYPAKCWKAKEILRQSQPKPQTLPIT